MEIISLVNAEDQTVTLETSKEFVLLNELFSEGEFKKCLEIIVRNRSSFLADETLSYLIIEMYCYYYLDKKNKSLDISKKIYSLTPTVKENNWLRISILIELRQYDTCIDFINTNFDIFENKGELYMYIGICHFHKHDYREAMNFFKKAVDLDFTCPEMNEYCGYCLTFVAEETGTIGKVQEVLNDFLKKQQESVNVEESITTDTPVEQIIENSIEETIEPVTPSWVIVESEETTGSLETV